MSLGQVLHYQQAYDIRVLVQARQTSLEDIAQIVLFDERHEEPEAQCLRAVHEQLAGHEVHALHVVHLLVVAGESAQHMPQFLVSLGALKEILVDGERTTQIAFNLGGRVGLGIQQLEAVIVTLALVVFVHDSLAHDTRQFLLLLLSERLGCKLVSEPTLLQLAL